ncbi:sigma factor G inhibitor Gin [Sulfuracidifex metallicus]|uniref:sigma factor G inhibitor Gin n=1 Tax=Sulfuracidifex metallicus TaxID=47303 RepID=UPI002273F424|nr:sigma factor G inhibitor Gin [Sulfuracidifex metallicus]MCY0850489.1 50S ribosomal protein L34e [Sulfuracidifex metallicus]
MKPYQRTSSLKKVYRRLPSSRTGVLLRKKRPSVAKCAICKKPLKGSVGSKQRIYGGFICHKCLQSLIKLSMRGIS